MKPSGRTDNAMVVTERLVQEMEKGNAPWTQPWKVVSYAPKRLSGDTYSLLNSMRLMYAAEDQGFKSNLWGGFHGWRALGRYPKPPGTPVAVWINPSDRRGREGGEEASPEDSGGRHEQRRGFLSYRYVFNYDQTEGQPLPPRFNPYPKKDLTPPRVNEQHARLKAFADAIAPSFCPIKHGGNGAYYVPFLDEVHMPNIDQFDSADDYWIAFYHEATHATGHPSRLGRLSGDAHQQTADMRSDSYSREELTAVFGSFLVPGALGWQPGPDVTGKWGTYARNYAARCRQDPRLLYHAIDKAGKAMDYFFKLAPEFHPHANEQAEGQEAAADAPLPTLLDLTSEERAERLAKPVVAVTEPAQSL